MKPLLKVMFVLALFFFSTFVVLKSTGVLSVERIRGWFEAAEQASPWAVGMVIGGLLFADLFVAVPTLTVMILGGYFLGAFYGATAAVVGILLAGLCGFGLSRVYGDRLLNYLIKDEEKRAEATEVFRAHGAGVILLSRAVPILPEVSACMAGMTGMPFGKFLILWLVSAVPYAAIATYAGSVSSLENPKPAILAAIGLSAFFWFGWMVFRKRTKAADAALAEEGSAAG